MLFSAISRLALWAGDTGADAAAEGGTDLWGMLISLSPILLIVVVFYFLIIRPESKRKKETAKLRNEIIVGDEITTIGGLMGRVVSIKDDTITIETGADKTKIKLMRWAISSKGTQISE